MLNNLVTAGATAFDMEWFPVRGNGTEQEAFSMGLKKTIGQLLRYFFASSFTTFATRSGGGASGRKYPILES